MAQRHFLQLGLSPLLLPLSWIYAFAMSFRKKLYDFKILKSYRSPVLTVCVGNISWGGTGKSPVVDYILTKMEEKHKKTVVLTRGYGQQLENYPLLLNNKLLTQYNLSKQDYLDQDYLGQDLTKKKLKAEKHNKAKKYNKVGNYNKVENAKKADETSFFPDEVLMLIKKHPQTDFLIDPKRMRAAQKIKKQENLEDLQTKKEDVYADFLLMDDGFQHFALERDYNFVLLDKDDLLPQNSLGFLWEKKQNWNRVIPLGSWREQKKALQRSSIFLLKCPESEWFFIRENAIKKLLEYQKPLFIFQIVLDDLENVFAEKEIFAENNIIEEKKIIENDFVEKNSSDQKSSSEKAVENNILATQNKMQDSLWNKREKTQFCDAFMKNKQSYALLCAVGNPEQVQKSVENFIGYNPTKTLFFADHHDFKKECHKLYQILEEMPIICTEKDAVKLEHLEELRHARYPIYAVKSHVQFYSSEFYEKVAPSLCSQGLSSSFASPRSAPISDFDHWIDTNCAF